jgi:type II secretory pathway pseudopilin PulG
VELLVVITILGIAASIVIPSMAQTGTLRVQGPIRMIVADITAAQSDAIAYQQGRAVIFKYNSENSRYIVADVVGTTVDTSSAGISADRNFAGANYGHTTISAVDLEGSDNNTIFFDALGGPVTAPGTDTPASSGYIELTSGTQSFRISIEAYTGRVTVIRL